MVIPALEPPGNDQGQEKILSKPESVGLFGGTFDPVHIGHLRTALELHESLQLEEMRMLPCADPYHREQTVTRAEHRLAMLKRAIDDCPLLTLDDRELHRPGPSYTLDTLREVRQEIGKDVPLMLCLGMDSLVNLASWHKWQSLPEYAHIVVACRPGFILPTSGPISRMIQQRRAENPDSLKQSPCGAVLIMEMTLLPVSATQIRHDVRQGLSIKYLVPESVEHYIDQNNLYT